jgi:hypothetical protein
VTPVAPTQAPVDPADAPTDAPPAVPTEAEPENAWEVVTETQADSAIRMSAFLDGEIGYWGGQGATGQARYTTDGGATWTLADTSGG